MYVYTYICNSFVCIYIGCRLILMTLPSILFLGYWGSTLLWKGWSWWCRQSWHGLQGCCWPYKDSFICYCWWFSSRWGFIPLKVSFVPIAMDCSCVSFFLFLSFCFSLCPFCWKTFFLYGIVNVLLSHKAQWYPYFGVWCKLILLVNAYCYGF